MGPWRLDDLSRRQFFAWEETSLAFIGVEANERPDRQEVGGHPPKASQEVIEQIKRLEGELHFETYYSLSCQNCPDVVQALNLMAILTPGVRHVAS
jgi:hypothetical protein